MNENTTIHVLLVDDDEDDYFLTKEILSEIGAQKFKIDWVSTYDDAIKKMKSCKHDIYLIDYRLGNNTGLDLLKAFVADGCEGPVIMLTGKGDQNIDMEAMRLGAADYLVKGKIDSLLLERTIRYAMGRSQSIKQLKESENKYRKIFEKSHDVIYITNKSGKLIDINKSAEILFGYTHEELLKMNASDLYLNPQDRKQFEEAIKNKGEVTDYEVTLKTKSGEKRYCLLTTILQNTNLDGEDVYQGIVHDITERKRAERELRNIEKLAVTGRIARTVAHEVRNPLTNVNLSVEQLKNEIGPNETYDMYFGIITRNCERINQLITELLNSAKPAALTYKSISINEILDDTIDLAQDRISLKGLEIIREYDEDLPDLLVDADKMKVALLNIVINAVEAVDANKGKIIISTSRKADKCIVKIQDNGPGIPKENMDKLFEPFFTGKQKGMGLGLTSSQNIIFNHKGTIEVESEENKGTTFAIAFKLNS